MRRSEPKYKNYSAILVAPLICALIFNGCATSKSTKIIHAEVMEKIVQGVTTKEEVKGLLGEPNGISRTSDGTEMWTYSSSDLAERLNKRRGTLLAATGASTAATIFIPVVGPFLGVATMWKATTHSTKVSAEIIMISFDQKGIVSSVSASAQTF